MHVRWFDYAIWVELIDDEWPANDKTEAFIIGSAGDYTKNDAREALLEALAQLEALPEEQP